MRLPVDASHRPHLQASSDQVKFGQGVLSFEVFIPPVWLDQPAARFTIDQGFY